MVGVLWRWRRRRRLLCLWAAIWNGWSGRLRFLLTAEKGIEGIDNSLLRLCIHIAQCRRAEHTDCRPTTCHVKSCLFICQDTTIVTDVHILGPFRRRHSPREDPFELFSTRTVRDRRIVDVNHRSGREDLRSLIEGVVEQSVNKFHREDVVYFSGDDGCIFRVTLEDSVRNVTATGSGESNGWNTKVGSFHCSMAEKWALVWTIRFRLSRSRLLCPRDLNDLAEIVWRNSHVRLTRIIKQMPNESYFQCLTLQLPDRVSCCGKTWAL